MPFCVQVSVFIRLFGLFFGKEYIYKYIHLK
jgi:hypothetical protein